MGKREFSTDALRVRGASVSNVRKSGGVAADCPVAEADYRVVLTGVQGLEELGLSGDFVVELGYEFAEAVERMGVAAAGYRQVQHSGHFPGELVFAVYGAAVGYFHGVGQLEYRVVKGVLRASGSSSGTDW